MFRFLTPVLVTVAIFILSIVINNQDKLVNKVDTLQKEQVAYFNNHLSEHKDFCVVIEHRLSTIEAQLGIANNKIKQYHDNFGK